MYHRLVPKSLVHPTSGGDQEVRKIRKETQDGLNLILTAADRLNPAEK